MRTREEKKASLLCDSNGIFKSRNDLKKDMNQAAKDWGKAENPVDATRYRVLFNNLKAILAELEPYFIEMERVGIPRDLSDIMRRY